MFNLFFILFIDFVNSIAVRQFSDDGCTQLSRLEYINSVGLPKVIQPRVPQDPRQLSKAQLLIQARVLQDPRKSCFARLLIQARFLYD